MIDWISQNAQTVIAISAIIISVISLAVAIVALYTQRKHNKLSVKPIPHFSKGDYENHIFVKIKNYGLGPLKIENFEIKKNKSTFKRLIDSFDGLASKVTWETFTDDIEGRVLAPQKEFVLIQASFTSEQNDIKQAIRESLAKTTLTIQSSCVYNEKQPEVKEELTWFARH